MSEDPEVLKLRQQLLKLCPEEQNQIMIMDKNDLQDLLSVVSNVPNINALEKRKNMQAKILQVCPGMDKQLEDLGDQDIQDIYTKCLEKQKQTLSKKKFAVNQVSIVEMKKILMEKLPAYRNDIKNMADNQIKKMYMQLQDEMKSTKNEKIQSQQYNRKRSRNGQPYDYNNRSRSYPQQPNGKRDQILNIKQSAKMRKLKHKCKISFYFNQSDFQEEISKNNENTVGEQSGKKRKNIVAKIVEGLYDVLGKKGWRKKESKNSDLKDIEKQKEKQVYQQEKQIANIQKVTNVLNQKMPPQQSQGPNCQKKEVM